MALKMDKMRKSYDKNSKGADFFQVKEGDTLIYVHPPCRPDDEYEPTVGTNYIAVAVHYGVGANRNMVVCLDERNNDWLSHPYIKQYIKEKGLKIGKKCPVCEEIKSGQMTDDEADESRLSTRYMWGVTPMSHRERPSSEYRDLDQSPTIGMLARTLYDGIMDIFMEEDDITDPSEAVLVKINRKGSGRMDTKYKVSAYTPTVKKRMKLKKALQRKIEQAMEEGGDCDLFSAVVNMLRGSKEVQALLSGVPIEDVKEPDTKDVEDEEDEYEEIEDTDDIEEEDDLEEDDEEEEIEPPKPKKKATKAKKKTTKKLDIEDEEEDEEEDDLEEDDEEEEIEPPKPKKKATKAKKKTTKKLDIEDEEEDEEEDDLEDDEDLGLDDLDREIAEIAKPKNKKYIDSAKAKKKAKKRS